MGQVLRKSTFILFDYSEDMLNELLSLNPICMKRLYRNWEDQKGTNCTDNYNQSRV